MYVPDLMHEFELGVWKALFAHLIRILHAYGNETISILNSWYIHTTTCWLLIEHGSRYRSIPPFGCATICKFHNNASAMKKLAARDFEDLLQVLHAGIVFVELLLTNASVQFLFLKACYHLTITGSFAPSFLKLQHGMDWLNLGSILKPPSMHWKSQLSDLVNV